MRYKILRNGRGGGVVEYVTSDGINVNEGTLLLYNPSENLAGVDLVKAYAPGSWSYVEAAPE